MVADEPSCSIDAKARRKTVFSVTCFKSALDICSYGDCFSLSKVRPKSHAGSVYGTLGLLIMNDCNMQERALSLVRCGFPVFLKTEARDVL